MRNCLPQLCLLLLLLHVPAPPARADDPSLPVPPWGRDLEEEHPSAAAPHDAAATHAEESGHTRWRFSADYWLAWTKNDRIPVLLTTGPTADARPGALGRQFTKILYGDAIDFEDRSGARFTLVAPLDAADVWSLAASYFLLDSRDVGVLRISPGSPVLARPFFDALNNREDSSLVTYPGLASGAVSIRSDSWLQGAEANLQRSLIAGEHGSIALLVGLRYLNLDEDLTINENTLTTSKAAKYPRRHIDVYDRFGADNDFFGGQIGLRSEWTHNRCTLGLTAKVALGNVHESTLVRGRTTVDTAPATDVPAGLFALASNSGRASRNEFAVVPEIGAKVGVRVSEHFTIYGGYNFFYWSNVARPGAQIDRNLNPNLIPTSTTFGAPGGPRQPVRSFTTDDYWAHGMIWGVEFRY